MLAAMNALPRTHLIPGAKSTLAAHVRGADGAPAVVLSHALLTSHRMWDAQAALLAAHGWRVVALDTRGHGASSASPPPYRIDELVGDVVAVLDALGIARAHYVGLSLGGMIGFGLGIAHPERVLSLVLCDTRADAPAAYAAPWDARIELARAHGCAALADATLERWFGRAFLDAHPDTAAAIGGLIAATPVDGFEGCARAIQGLDLLDRVERIGAPTTLLVGANDGDLPQVLAQLRARMRDAELEVIADAGHLANVDQRERFDAALLRHFARLAAPA